MAYEFLIIGLTIIIGFITMIFFERTRVSQVIPLMLFGFLLGPVLGLLDVSPESMIVSVLPFIATLALIVLLFDGGMEFDIFSMARAIPKSMLFTLLVFVLSVVIVSLFCMLVLGWSLAHGALLGAVIGGVSSAVVIAMVEMTGLRRETKAMLTVESTLTDALCIVTALILVRLIVAGQALTVGTITNILLAQITIAILFGLIAAAIWMALVERFVLHRYAYMLMLALVFILFAVTEGVEASGGIAVFVFGMALGNARKLGRITQTHWENPISRMMKLFQDEVTFFVRTFFFVYIGFLLSPQYFNQYVVLVGFALTALLLLPRIVAKKLVLRGIRERDGNVAATMMPRGLAAVVLATLPITSGITLPSFQELVFAVLLFSNIIATLGIYIFDRGEDGEEEKKEEKKEEIIEPREEKEEKKKKKKG